MRCNIPCLLKVVYKELLYKVRLLASNAIACSFVAIGPSFMASKFDKTMLSSVFYLKRGSLQETV